MAEEYGLNHMGENDEDEDDDDEGNVIAPPAPAPAPATVPEVIIKEETPMEMVLEQEAPVAHEVILVDAEPELCSPTSTALRMMDDLDDLDDRPKPALTWMSGFPKMGVMIEIESSI